MQPLGSDAVDTAVGPSQVEAYEKLLASLLGFRNTAEVREAFERAIVQQAAELFTDTLAEVRAKNQPDEFALANAIERALISVVDDEVDVDLNQLFEDPEHHEMPSDAVAAKVIAAWEKRA
jgi:hypothetical protein